MTAAWQRFGPGDRHWNSDLTEEDRLAVLGENGKASAKARPLLVAGALDETNSRICRHCWAQVPRHLFSADSARVSGLARVCTPCAERRSEPEAVAA